MNTNPNAKRVLFYGDSYIFGKVPGGARFQADERFTGIVQKELGQDFEIIEEGLRGRTASGENTFFPHRNGIAQFGPILGSHLPIDLLVIFIGTNDINSGSHKTTSEIAEVFGEYKNLITWWCQHLDFPEPFLILVSPPIIEEEKSYSIFKDIFKGAGEKSNSFAKDYEAIAKKCGWRYFDSAQFVSPSDIDGIHLDKNSNKILGQELAKFLRT